MDYTTQPLSFKIKKTLRYLRLYGVVRTRLKVEGQYHMKKTYRSLPRRNNPKQTGGRVGLIGCGNFAYTTIAYYLKKNYGDVLRAAMDVDLHRSASLYRKYGLAYYTDRAEDLMEDGRIELLYVASNHASHAEYGIRALEAGKSVHIEKPHVVNEEQLMRLCLAMRRSPGKVNLGFNRPFSRIGLAIRESLDSQPGPAMFNWFIAGHEIDPDHWYFKKEEGGRVLGNLCHWIDFVLRLVPLENRYPVKITPTRSSKSDCDIAVTYLFGDGSIAAVTFSAKGHTFEGVRERFAAHKGNVLISMDDFQRLVVEEVERKRIVSGFYRDHGHEATVRRSYELIDESLSRAGESVDYVWQSGLLFLKTKEALDRDAVVGIRADEASAPMDSSPR